MSLIHAPTPPAADAVTTQTDDTVLWLHAAFCEMGLPIRAARGNWRRDIGTGSLRIEPGTPEEAPPSGRTLRLVLMHICDAAMRANSVVVALGDTAAAFADRIGGDAKARDLADQTQRMLAAKISVAVGGGPEYTMFDARSRSRVDNPEWRSSIRLTSRFLTSLADHAIALDRRVVNELSDSPLALDAYAWIRFSLHGETPDSTLTTSWDELLKRFGTASQTVASFRTAFELALRLVFDADHSIELAVDDEGVSVRQAAEEQAEAAADVPPAPAPAPPAPEPVAEVVAPVSIAPPPAPPERPHPRPARNHPAPTAPAPSDEITQDSICLARHLTGLPQGIWLRRGYGDPSVLIGVTPGARFEPEKLTVLAMEPMVLQVSGGLYQQDFDRVSAWVMANRDLIDEFWEGGITTFEEINRRVRKAPAPGWR
ncbi:replication protein RepA [Humitalea sp. 24SJ18S-53]|uniref:replication protein RepA n=1 Tax=Humitalea sp. 24SJ18S-53 TaxID=3422307 RepID=UPI003D677582